MKHRGGQEEVAYEEFDDRVVVPAAVFKGLRAVALSGKANMLDRRMVQSWAPRMVMLKPLFGLNAIHLRTKWESSRGS
jgi:hypothetical protein